MYLTVYAIFCVGICVQQTAYTVDQINCRSATLFFVCKGLNTSLTILLPLPPNNTLGCAATKYGLLFIILGQQRKLVHKNTL